MRLGQKDGKWVILDDQKNVVQEFEDRDEAIAAFKLVGTKPRGTCPHKETIRKFRWRRRPVIWSVPYDKIYIRDEGQGEFYVWCQNCQKEVEPDERSGGG